MPSSSSELEESFLGRPVILRAGAGAGKTSTLIRVFFQVFSHFRQRRQRWPRIRLTTFTKLATQEIRDRLAREALTRKDGEAFEFLQSGSHVQISTIHGVLTPFLAQFGDVLGWPKDFKILEDSELLRYQKKCLRETLESGPDDLALLESFSFQDLLDLGLRFLYHPPSGRRVGLNEELLKKDLIEFKDRVLKKSEFLRLRSQGLDLSESWKVWTESLARMRDLLELSVYDLQESLEANKDLFKDFLDKPRAQKSNGSERDHFQEEAKEWIESLEVFLGYMESWSQRVHILESHEKFLGLFTRFEENWFSFQRRSGVCSIADLERLAKRVIDTDSSTAVEFSKSWDYWMIDEYQDTSPLQVELLRSLRGDRPYFVVGDPQQSIYLFRGARREVFFNEVEAVSKLGGEVQTQFKNFRSRKEVLEVINDIFSGSTFESMEVGSQVSVPDRNPLVLFQSREEQAFRESICWILEALKQGERPSNFGVLSRSHKNLAKFAKELKRFGIPYQVVSSGPFFQRREVLDILFLMRFLLNPHDNINFVGLLRVPEFLVSGEEILGMRSARSYWSEAARILEPHPSVRILRSLLEDSKVFGWFGALRMSLRKSGLFFRLNKEDPSGQKEANVWKLIAILEKESRNPKFDPLDFCRRKLQWSLRDSDSENESSAVHEPERVRCMTIHASKGLQFKHVLLIGAGESLRKSGLPEIQFSETDGVFILNLRNSKTNERFSLPIQDRIREEWNQRELEEFGRLFYVAATRAEETLALQWTHIKSGSWMEWLPPHLKKESCFFPLQDIDPDPWIPKEESPKIPKFSNSKWVESAVAPSPKPQSITEILNSKDASSASVSTKSFPLAMQVFEKTKQGQEAHRVFEVLRHQGFDNLLAFEGVLSPDLESALSFLREIKNPNFGEFIRSARSEWGFNLKVGASLFRGQIDLWGEWNRKLWVIDYKTGSKTDFVKSFKQLRFYAGVLQMMNKNPDLLDFKLMVINPMPNQQVLEVTDLQASETSSILSGAVFRE